MQKKQDLRVVILDLHPGRYFWVIFCFSTGCDCMHAPLFVQRGYIERAKINYLFFPWRSPSSTYDPLNERKSQKYSLFWKMGRFWGKGRTPGERCQNCLELTQWCSPELLGSQHCLVSRNFYFRTQNFPKLPLFHLIFEVGIPQDEKHWNKGHFEKLLRLEKGISAHQAMSWVQEFRTVSLS